MLGVSNIHWLLNSYRMSANVWPVDDAARCDAVAMATVMEIACVSTGAERGVIIVERGGGDPSCYKINRNRSSASGASPVPTRSPRSPANQSGPPDTPLKS